MKKLLILVCALFALSATSFAQRIAVVEFKAGVGISQQDVDGISAIFGTYFSPRGYTIVERTTIDRVIDEQQFQRGKITEQQMVRIGKILNVSKIVVGDVNIVLGEYNIDVRVVNVESGTIAAKDGATWVRGNSYRDLMKGIATRLSSQIAIDPESVVETTIDPESVVAVEQKLKIGDIYEANGKRGVVFAVSKDGKHGRILSLEQTKCKWDEAKQWCSELGEGWRLPTAKELKMISELSGNRDFYDGIFFADAPEMMWGERYWFGEETDTGRARLVGMSEGTGSPGNRPEPDDAYVRAVSAF